ncbi:MAG: hypothetical protein FJ390_03950 [Verrucomicrobia bacterium]|nr:hypothetical protein [Verrucomicrobiota bacterium]
MLLSASLFSMEFPGREKKEEGKISSPPRSSAEQTALNRRNEEAHEQDSVEVLARSFDSCQLADPTVNTPQLQQEKSSALQSQPYSVTDGDMYSDSFSFSDNRAAAANITPDVSNEKKSFQSLGTGHFQQHAIKDALQEGEKTIPFVTPSSPPGKRSLGVFNSDASPASPLARHQLTFESPAKAARPCERLPLSQQDIQAAVRHADAIVEHANTVRDSFYAVYDVVKPKDFKKLEGLSDECTNIDSAISALTSIKENLKKFNPSSSYPADLLLKLRLANTTVQEAIERAHATAEVLTSDEQYGAVIGEALTSARSIIPQGADLLRQTSLLTQAPPLIDQSTLSFQYGAEDRAEDLHEIIDSGQKILCDKASLIENATTPALRLFGAVNDTENQDALTKAREKVEAMALMMEVAIKNTQAHLSHSSSSTGSSVNIISGNKEIFSASEAMRVSREATLEALQEMKNIVSHVSVHSDSWPLDVSKILENLRSTDAAAEI